MHANWKEILASHLSESDHPLVAILGPTAGGKTAFSLEAARYLAEQGKRAEVVNADSRQLYRLLDIGTAKILPNEMQGVPHHLLDVLDPSEECTAARYRVMAEEAIDGILDRGNVPLLVGGSMLYLSAVLDGLSFVEQSDPVLRARLEEAYDRDAGAALYARLQDTDPDTAAAFHPRNKPYLLRAMEILEATGNPPSALKEAHGCRYHALLLGVRVPREELQRRIGERIVQMVQAGWVREVQDLLARGYDPADPAMKSHGYREIMEALLAGRTVSALESDARFWEKIAAKTRQYAKRQLTWWRGNAEIRWIECL